MTAQEKLKEILELLEKAQLDIARIKNNLFNIKFKLTVKDDE